MKVHIPYDSIGSIVERDDYVRDKYNFHIGRVVRIQTDNVKATIKWSTGNMKWYTRERINTLTKIEPEHLI